MNGPRDFRVVATIRRNEVEHAIASYLRTEEEIYSPNEKAKAVLTILNRCSTCTVRRDDLYRCSAFDAARSAAWRSVAEGTREQRKPGIAKFPETGTPRPAWRPRYSPLAIMHSGGRRCSGGRRGQPDVARILEYVLGGRQA